MSKLRLSCPSNITNYIEHSASKHTPLGQTSQSLPRIECTCLGVGTCTWWIRRSHSGASCVRVYMSLQGRYSSTLYSLHLDSTPNGGPGNTTWHLGNPEGRREPRQEWSASGGPVTSAISSKWAHCNPCTPNLSSHRWRGSVHLPGIRSVYFPGIRTFHNLGMRRFHLPVIRGVHLPEIRCVHLPGIRGVHLPGIKIFHLPGIKIFYLPGIKIFHLSGIRCHFEVGCRCTHLPLYATAWKRRLITLKEFHRQPNNTNVRTPRIFRTPSCFRFGHFVLYGISDCWLVHVY